MITIPAGHFPEGTIVCASCGWLHIRGQRCECCRASRIEVAVVSDCRFISIEYVNGHQFDLIYYDAEMKVQQIRLDADGREDAIKEACAYFGVSEPEGLTAMWNKSQHC